MKVGDVVFFNPILKDPITAMTICGFDKQGFVECVWFDRQGKLKQSVWDKSLLVPLDKFYDSLRARSRFVLSIPSSVMLMIQAYNKA
jgi:uncharacterized protein YodC (DUF2158 family)